MQWIVQRKTNFETCLFLVRAHGMHAEVSIVVVNILSVSNCRFDEDYYDMSFPLNEQVRVLIAGCRV